MLLLFCVVDVFHFDFVFFVLRFGVLFVTLCTWDVVCFGYWLLLSAI